jgi:hypothetical protein
MGLVKLYIIGAIIVTAITGFVLHREFHDRNNCKYAMTYPDWRNNHCGPGNLVYD